jgi:response regulator RpfG family c-di-GMP phosphodiesterase
LKSPSFNNTNTILLLDDEFDITTALRQGLEKQGFRVFGFTDPLLALEHFQINHKQYGLVISDLRMPGMNGYEFVKKAKEIKPQVKIFLMTAFDIDDNESRRVLQSVKIDEFIQKPISFKDLSRMISKHINIQINAN